jgi:hypothetical protein
MLKVKMLDEDMNRQLGLSFIQPFTS